MVKEKTIPNSELSKTDNEKIGEFIYSLGRYDAENQINEIDLFIEYLQNSRKKYNADYTNKSKMYIICGFSFGIIIALVLM